MPANIKGPYALNDVTKVGKTITASAVSEKQIIIKNSGGNEILTIETSGGDAGIIYIKDSGGAVKGFWGSTSANIGGNSSIASSVLSCETTTKGFLPPKLTTVQRNAIGSPTTGLIVFDTDLQQICVYVTGKWQKVTQTDA
jgi:hypothetical protein